MDSDFNSYKSGLNLAPLIKLCETEGRRVIYEKDDYLIHQGDTERHISLVKSGYCRYVGLRHDGEEALVGLAFAGEFAVDFNNGVRHAPSMVSIIASTRVEVLQLNLEYALSRILEAEPDFLYKASDSLFLMCYRRLLDLYVLTPAERYIQFAMSYPEIVSKIKAKELASYLQISHQHLLRIKRTLAKENI